MLLLLTHFIYSFSDFLACSTYFLIICLSNIFSYLVGVGVIISPTSSVLIPFFGFFFFFSKRIFYTFNYFSCFFNFITSLYIFPFFFYFYFPCYNCVFFLSAINSSPNISSFNSLYLKNNQKW